MNTTLILGAVAVILSVSGFVTGCQYQQSKAEKTIRNLEHQYQESTDKINGEKNAQLKTLNSDLNNALVSLRSRPSSPTKTADGKDCNGQTLSAPDAEFLIREASRADEIRIGLEACYKQYEVIQ